MSKGNPPGYKSYPDLEPYTSTNLYGDPKEDFKTIGARLKSLLDLHKAYKVADLGCGNGALLYYLHQQYPHWKLYGYDFTSEYIETAQRFEGLKGVNLFHQDFLQLKGTFDVVLSTCLLSVFKDIRKPLKKMLGLCRKGGWLLGTGLFNPFDIEVRVEFCDNTHPQTRGQWRTDFNRHSQQSIRNLFANKVQTIEFEECPFGVEIAPDPKNPIRVWTVKNDQGRNLLINGAEQICNQTLLIIRK